MNINTIISNTILILCILVALFLIIVISRAVFRKQPLIGHPPIPVFFFILAKFCVVVNLAFLFLGALRIHAYSLLEPGLVTDIPALILLTTGLVILVISSIQLNKDLMFGLPREKQDLLQTKGIYAISRHPFYVGFLFILFSSSLLYPNIINILAFITAWAIHHFIMIKEEEFLEKAYGEEYRQYRKKVRRYITLKY